MRKLVYTAFVAFWAVVATIFALDRLGDTSDVEAGPADASAPSAAYTLEEVARHDAAEDCWVAIDGSVYDLTEYLPRHPAAPEVLSEWCGLEATEGMRTKGRNRRHSDRAWRLLERYRIGILSD